MFFALLSACTGPRPEAGAPVILSPAHKDDAYRVSLVVRNQGTGEGQVEVDIWLHEKKRNETYFADRKVNLRSHESVHLIVDVQAPPGEYVAEVKAQYPPG